MAIGMSELKKGLKIVFFGSIKVYFMILKQKKDLPNGKSFLNKNIRLNNYCLMIFLVILFSGEWIFTK